MTELKVGIDYRPALILKSGIGRYVANLVRHLPEADEELHLALFSVFWEKHAERVERASLPESERVELVTKKFPGRILNFLGKFTPLSVETWADELDLFHFTDYVHLPVKTEPIVFTLHDLAFLRSDDFHPSGDTKQLTAVASQLAQRAAAVIAVSEATKNDAIELLKIPEERIVVTPLGVDATFFTEAPRSVQDPPAIVSVGTLEPRKNHLRLIEAFEVVMERGLDAKLILAGRKGWMCDDVLKKLEDEALQGRVIWLGEVSEVQLTALYRSASVVAYPSLWEGFGLPVLEAMAAGAPVLTSDRGAMKEVAGEAALLVDPESVEALADGLVRLLEDAALRDELSAKGRLRAREFTWTRTAKETVKAYRLALELGPPAAPES